MYEPRPLRVLFLTSFSDSCYRAIPAMAQMADELAVQLTILHTFDPARQSRSEAETRLRSFYPEADHYGICRRVAMPGKTLEAFEELRKENAIDLIFAPASDPLGVPRIGHISMRSRLVRDSGLPIWTTGSKVQIPKLHAPTRNVACWIDFESPDKTHLKLAFEYAWKLDAKLHLLHVLPEVNEGSLLLPLYYNKPLHPQGAAEEIRRMIGWVPITLEIHIAAGGSGSGILGLLRKCDADVLFVGKGQVLRTGLLGARLNSVVDKAPCPVVCVGGGCSAMPIWKLDRGSAFLARTAIQRQAKVGN